jgi:hypothetical protein
VNDDIVSVLQVYHRPSDASESAVRMHRFEREAQEDYLTPGTPHIAHYHRLSPDRAFTSVTFASFPGFKEYEPLAISVYSRHRVAVSWRHRTADLHKVVVHSETFEEDPPKLNSTGKLSIFFWGNSLEN